MRFYKLNVDDNPSTAMNYSISSIPTIASLRGRPGHPAGHQPCPRTSSPHSSACNCSK